MNNIKSLRIINVWNYNLTHQINLITSLTSKYPIISIDTEFPGIIAYPSAQSKHYNYKLLKMNVDRLKIIQFGISLSDSHGNHPKYCGGWQFNFKFDFK